MSTLFKILRNISTCTILLILLDSFGYKDVRTWGIFALVYVAMFCDFIADLYKNNRGDHYGKI